MPVNRLNDTLMQRICELRPGQRITQTRNFVWLIIGIFQSRSVCLGRIAGKIPGPAKLVSTTRRLSRLLDYPAIRVREWYEPIARQWSQAQWMCLREIRLIVDGTEVSYGHQLLMVSMVYRKRTIPIAWTLVLQARGHSSAFKQLALLNYVRQLLPMGAVVFLVGDCEFGSVEVLTWLNQWGLGSGNPRGWRTGECRGEECGSGGRCGRAGRKRFGRALPARGKKKGEQKKHGEKWAHEDTLFPRTSGCTLIVYVDGAKKLGI